MTKQEILPPLRNTQLSVVRPQTAVATVNVPRVKTGGYVVSALTEWQSNYTSRAVDALTRLNASETALALRQTELIESTIKQREALLRLQELPERLGHELAIRRIDRADSYRHAQHGNEMNELRRLKEITHAEADLTHARTVLTDAKQQLQAQQEYGGFNYELMHKKKNLELLDIQLGEQERRALMRKQLRELEPESQDEIDDALYAKRDQLNAAGLDTSRIDAVIESRKK